MSDESVDGVIVLHHRAEDTMSLPGTIHPDRIALSLPGDIGCTDFVRFLEAFSLHTRNTRADGNSIWHKHERRDDRFALAISHLLSASFSPVGAIRDELFALRSLAPILLTH